MNVMWALLVVIAMVIPGATAFSVEMVAIGIPMAFACAIGDWSATSPEFCGMP